MTLKEQSKLIHESVEPDEGNKVYLDYSTMDTTTGALGEGKREEKVKWKYSDTRDDENRADKLEKRDSDWNKCYNKSYNYIFIWIVHGE